MSAATPWEPGDPVFPAPSPDVCTSCHQYRPTDMALHSGHIHICQDCVGEAS